VSISAATLVEILSPPPPFGWAHPILPKAVADTLAFGGAIEQLEATRPVGGSEPVGPRYDPDSLAGGSQSISSPGTMP
jgi:hypothetical protein